MVAVTHTADLDSGTASPRGAGTSAEPQVTTAEMQRQTPEEEVPRGRSRLAWWTGAGSKGVKKRRYTEGSTMGVCIWHQFNYYCWLRRDKPLPPGESVGPQRVNRPEDPNRKLYGPRDPAV